MPTFASDPEGVDITMETMDPELLQAPPIDVNDFHKALQKTKPTVSLDDLKPYDEWTEEFGIEG